MISEDVQRWIERDPDPNTQAELTDLLKANDQNEIALRFSGRLAFGTAGLRGVIGAGPMRMNRLVVRETSAGLGAYLLKNVKDAAARGVVVGYDGRILSLEFAQDTARVLAALGIKVYLSPNLISTPVTAYAVTRLNAAAGVMVTASHNPPEYNGYKVYWGNGAQIIPPHDTGIAAFVDEAAANPIPWREESPLIESFPADLVDSYMKGVRTLSIHGPEGRDALCVAYTPMHGVGAEPTLRALAEAGFKHVYPVLEQQQPDGHFPTVRFPNPEEPGAMDLVVKYAGDYHADLAIANDPDADRLAVAARDSSGEYQMLRGDQIGTLLGWDRLKHARANSAHVAVATTIVSSQLLGEMADSMDATYFETLTGFKWIANAALANPEVTFAFGYEEALGYTVGELVRDKDGVSAAVMFCEMAAALKLAGKTVLDELDAIYREFGVYLTGQRSLNYAPDDTVLRGLTDRLRAAPPKSVGGLAVLSYTDLRTGIRRTATGTETVDLPKSDVLIFRLEQGARIIVRPSGTEPKIKFYYEVRQAVDGDLNDAKADAQRQLDVLMEAPLD
jgi:phosphomannomutase